LIFAALIALRAIASEWGAVSNNVQMSISLKVVVGQSFSLRVRYQNLSTNQIVRMYISNYPYLESFGGMGFVVISPTGKDISPQEKTSGSYSGGFARFGSNEVKEAEFPLGDVYKLNEIGDYHISAKKTLLIGTNSVEVVSNPLLVSVVATNASSTNDIPTPKPN